MDFYRSQSALQNGTSGLQDVLTEGWNPGNAQSGSNGNWGRRDEAKDGPTGADICWDSNGSVQPLGLVEMGEEEKEVGAIIISPT